MIKNRKENIFIANIIAIVFLLFFISLPNLMWGQGENRDSLTHRFLLLDSLAEYNSNQGNDSIAIVYANKALVIGETLYGKDHHEYAHILSNLAKYKFEAGDYNEAKEFISSAIEIQKNNPHTKDYAESLLTLSDITALEGNFPYATERANESILILSSLFGANSIEVATAKTVLADIYYENSSFSKTLELCDEAIAIFITNGITKDSRYAQLLSIRGKAKTDLGLYLEALVDAKESLDVYVSLYGEQYISNAALLSNISVINSYLGNYPEAYRYGEKALRLFKQTYGERHPYYVITLQNISDYKHENGELMESIQLAEKANNICDNVDEDDFPMYIYVSGKIKLANYYVEIGNYEGALLIINEAICYLRQTNNMNTDEYASALLVLADIYSIKGIHNKAIKCATESTIIIKNKYGKNSVRYSQFLNNLSHYYSNSLCYNEAVKYAMLSMKIRKQFIIANYSDMSYSQRKDLWSRFRPSFFYYAGLAFRCHSPRLISDVYDNTCLFAKSLLLSTELSMMQFISESNDNALINDYREMLSLKEHYKKICEQPLAVSDIIADSLAQEVHRREIEIIRKSKTYGNYMSCMNVSWNHIQQRLGVDDIAIEFIDFPVKNDSVMYVALTLRKDDESPKLIPLFEEKQLKSLSDTLYYQCEDMANLAWEPLIKEFKGIKNIYFSPSGALHKIGIEYLPGMENYNIYRLSSTRELVTDLKTGTKKRAVLYGGLNYDAEFDKSVTDRSLAMLDEAFIERPKVRGMGLRGGKEFLKHTKEEVDIIGKELNNANWECVLDTAAMGTEESFKALSGKNVGCLHISTHGFYYNKEDADNARYKFMLIDNNMISAEDKALTRSGLVMSGANHILEDEVLPDNVEDGILTAKEIADVDLRGLDLVVLSACQTGLGDIAQGEGVFGLQRGFKKAGANSILMSLWEVDDKATQIMMTQFYRNLLSGQSKRQSLLSAQKYLRKVDDGRYDEPKYWAAFILLDGIN